MIQYHLGKANVIIYALSKMWMGSLAHIQEVKRPLMRELHRLLDEKVSLEIGEYRAFSVFFQVRSDLVNRIKVAQMKDE